MEFDVEPIPPDYVFDMNADYSFWQRPTGSSISQNNHNDGDDLPLSNQTIHQDLNNNNNVGISFDDVEMDNAIEISNNDDNNNRIEILRGEYEYKAFGSIRNFWAGPTYWKFSKNSNRNVLRVQTDADNRVGQRKKTQIKVTKPNFYETDDEGESSSDEYFIKTNSRKARKIRVCNRLLWNSERLKLPPQCNIPKDIFDKKRNPNQQSSDPNQMDNIDFDDNDYAVSSH